LKNSPDARAGGGTADPLADPKLRANPAPLYEKLRERPAWYQPPGSYFIGRYEDVASLLRDPRLSADPATWGQSGAGFSFANMDPPGHDRLRRAVMRHFGPPNNANRFDLMVPALKALVTDLIDKLTGRHEFDLVAEISPFPCRVIGDILGVPHADAAKLAAMAETIFQAADRPDLMQSGLRQLGGYFSGLLNARRAAPGDDLLSRLCEDGPDGA